MFARLHTYHQPRPRDDELLGWSRDEVAGVPGLEGAVVLATENGDTAALTLWDTRADAELLDERLPGAAESALVQTAEIYEVDEDLAGPAANAQPTTAFLGRSTGHSARRRSPLLGGPEANGSRPSSAACPDWFGSWCSGTPSTARCGCCTWLSHARRWRGSPGPSPRRRCCRVRIPPCCPGPTASGPIGCWPIAVRRPRSGQRSRLVDFFGSWVETRS
jgi:hypothetical protein